MTTLSEHAVPQPHAHPQGCFAPLHRRVVLARLGPLTLVSFGPPAAAGGALAMLLVFARMFQAGLEPLRFAPLLFALVPAGAVAGSRFLAALLHDWPRLRQAPLQTLFRPGFAFQGGFLVVTAGVIGVARGWGLPLLTVLDCFVLGLPLGHAIGRLGCHTYGCCHGRPTSSRLAVRYTDPDTKAVWGSGLAGVPLHPVQLYSAAGNLGLFLALNLLALGPRPPGALAAVYLLLGATGRFLVEGLRGIPTRRIVGLSAYQVLCLVLFASGLALLGGVRGVPPVAVLAGWDGFRDGILQAARHPQYPVVVFLVALLGFGVQGRRVGGGLRGTGT